ncbi:MAG: divalent metal cation transporter [Patescibacteria group bacterium]|jgi:Mn2+/Fe2+ NRAMP family transporter
MRIIAKFFKKLGPGLITGSADDDPSGIATYSSAGAQYGFKLLWGALFTLPLMIAVQEMCARITMVSGQGLAATFKRFYSQKVLGLAVALLFLANTFNIGGDLGMMASAVNLLAPSAPTFLLIVLIAVLSLFLEIILSYRVYFHILKWLCLSLLAYWATALLVVTDWPEVWRNLFLIHWEWSKGYLMILVAFLGTTISPYLFFWQAGQELEEEIAEGRSTIKERKGVTSEELKRMRFDVISGMLFSNLTTFFIIITTAVTLHRFGIYNIGSAAEAALALRPLAGDFTYLLFTVGIIGTGLLAIPVLAGSTAYALAELLKWKEGLSLKWRRAYGFYGIMALSIVAGILMNFANLNPIKALIYSAVLNGLIAPLFIGMIIVVANKSKIMGENVNGFWSNFFGYMSLGLMAMAGMAFIVSLFL